MIEQYPGEAVDNFIAHALSQEAAFAERAVRLTGILAFDQERREALIASTTWSNAATDALKLKLNPPAPRKRSFWVELLSRVS